MLVYCDTGNWLYVLLGIAWVVYSIYKGSAKKKGQEQTKPGPKKNASFLEGLIDDLVDESPVGDDEVIYKDPFEEASVIKEDEVVSAPDPVQDKEGGFDSPDGEGIPVTGGISGSVSEIQVKPKKHRKISRLNLKKAIIYSEILRRPYQ